MRYFLDPVYAYPHYVMLDAANEEGLLKVSKLATLRDDVVAWLDENIGQGTYIHSNGIISFVNKEDAMAFILRWQP